MAKGELLSPGLGAEYINELVEYGRQAFRDHLRLLLTNMMQSGYIWFTKPMTPKERREYLDSEAAVMEAAMMMNDPDPNVRSRGVELGFEIEEARNGQQATA